MVAKIKSEFEKFKEAVKAIVRVPKSKVVKPKPKTRAKKKSSK